MKAKLATVNLEVTDIDRSKRFYRDVLGMNEDDRRSHAPDFVYLRSPGCDVTLASPPGSVGATPSHTIEIGFEVDNIAAMRDHLCALGIRSYRQELMGWGEALELRDPDGHRVLVYSFERRDAGSRPPG